MQTTLRRASKLLVWLPAILVLCLATPALAGVQTIGSTVLDPNVFTVYKATDLKVALEPGTATDLYGYTASVARTGTANLRYFRWVVPTSGVTKVRVQVLKHRNSPAVSTWSAPTGILAQTTLAVTAKAGTAQAFSIAFDKLDPLKPFSPTYFPIGTSPPLGYLWVFGKPPLLNPTPVYVRVIALGSDGQPIALPSPTVTIAFGNFKPVSPTATYTAPMLTITEVDYVVGRLESWDARCRGKVTQAVGFAKVGDDVNLCSTGSYSGPFSTLWEAATGSIDFAAALYNGIQEVVVTGVANLVADLTGCTGVCKDGLRWALHRAVDLALASINLPPELPNSHQVFSEGKDYMAQVGAEALLGKGYTADVAAKYGRQAVDELEAKLRSTELYGADGTRWFHLDPALQYSAPRLRITVTNKTTGTLPPEQLRMEDANNRFGALQPIYVPALAPGQSLTIPVVLRATAIDPNGWKSYLTTGAFGGPDFVKINNYVTAWNVLYAYSVQSFRAEVSLKTSTGDFGAGFGLTKGLGYFAPTSVAP